MERQAAGFAVLFQSLFFQRNPEKRTTGAMGRTETLRGRYNGTGTRHFLLTCIFRIGNIKVNIPKKKHLLNFRNKLTNWDEDRMGRHN